MLKVLSIADICYSFRIDILIESKRFGCSVIFGEEKKRCRDLVAVPYSIVVKREHIRNKAKRQEFDVRFLLYAVQTRQMKIVLGHLNKYKFFKIK